MRWTLTNPTTGETWEMPINPDQMTSPEPSRSFKFSYGVRRKGGQDYTRAFLQRPQAVSWQWQGVIHTEEHYRELEKWSRKDVPIHVRDHLDRVWRVLITQFDPVDRRPTVNKPWRSRYTMSTTILRRVS